MNETSNKLEHLTLAAEELNKCGKCGECRSVCPIFAEDHLERHVARGKLGLTEAILNGELDLTRGYDESIGHCLLCLACVESCGGNVRVDRIVKAARADLAREHGLPYWKRWAFKTLAEGKGSLGFLARSGSVLQYLLFKRLPKTSGLRRRFPLPLIARDQYVPALTWKPFRSRCSEALPDDEIRDTVVFFTGCSANYMFPRVAESVTRVLTALGIKVLVPGEQMCCGAPMEAGGDMTAATRLARHNLDLLSAQENKIIVPCSSCGSMLKHGYADLMSKDEVYRDPAQRVSERTYDISEYLVKEVGLDRIGNALKRTYPHVVTYHDPCHLGRGQGVVHEPRELLKSACRDNFIEMKEANRCCGSGGLYGLTHRETSLAILDRKTRHVVEAKAEVLATGCPACLIQLQEGVLRAGIEVKPIHTVEILDWCLGGDKKLSHAFMT
jgi:glycolate oxidase iron-sulfur subunit